METDSLQREIFQIEENDKIHMENTEQDHKEKLDSLKQENDSLRKKLQSRLLNK